jgi:hypothetical protein
MASNMRMILVSAVVLAGPASLPCYGEVTADTSTRSRYIVLTDISGDPDDQQSLCRLMLYSNEFDIEVIAVSPFNGQQAVGLKVVEHVLAGYEKVRPNLARHTEGYPTAEYLRSIVKPGWNADNYRYMSKNSYWDYIGEGKDTPASEAIIAALKKDDPRPVYMGAWGGTVNLAQALWKITKTCTPQQASALKSKIRLYDISSQDSTWQYIAKEHKDIFYIKSQTVWIGWYLRSHEAKGANDSLVDMNWANTNIKGHGALSDCYPTSTGPSGVKEGDTPSFMFAYRNGLSDPERPDWGSWAGRFHQAAEMGPHYWSDDESSWGGAEGWKRRCATVYQWREHYQNDFQARWDWCVKDLKDANHNPVAAFKGDKSRNVVLLNAKPGEKVELNADGTSDVDGNQLSYKWWHLSEAEPTKAVKAALAISNASAASASFTVPNELGKTIHVILEVTDNGTPNLKSYKRIVFTIAEK